MSRTRKEYREEARKEAEGLWRYTGITPRFFLMIRSKEKTDFERIPLSDYELVPWLDLKTRYWTAFLFETFDGECTQKRFHWIADSIAMQVEPNRIFCDVIGQPCDWTLEE